MQYLGIDVSKEKFDVALILDESEPSKLKKKAFSNDATGFEKLSVWLRSRATEPVHAAMEATNTYWEALGEYLSDRGLVVSVVNPALIKKEAQSWGMRNKTDRADAEVIARFCLAKKPKAWVAPTAQVRELRDMVRHLDALQDERQRHKNQLDTATSDTVVASLERLVVFIDAQIDELKKKISDHIDHNPDLKAGYQLLGSICGIGDKTVAVILSELPDVSNFSSAKSVAAYAGLSPKRVESGKMKGTTRLCKFGNARLRRALYFPAIVAIRFNPLIREFYTRLRKNGKCKMSAIGACMRKLLVVAYGVLKTGTSFTVPA